MAFATNIVAAALLVVALTLVVGFPIVGSLVFALMIAAIGCVYAAVGGVAAQLAQTSALSRTVGVGVVIFALTPGVAGADDGTALLSPIGWIRFVRPFDSPQWWVLAVPVAVAIVLTAAAAWLATVRDLGTGALPDVGGTMGPPVAARWLRGPIAFAWRLHRANVTSWAVSAATVSAMIGWSSAAFDGSLGAVDFGDAWLGRLRDEPMSTVFLAVLTYVGVMLVACSAVAIASRAWVEERSGHASTVLATPTSRARWLVGHGLVAFAGPTALLLLIGVCSGVAFQRRDLVA